MCSLVICLLVHLNINLAFSVKIPAVHIICAYRKCLDEYGPNRNNICLRCKPDAFPGPLLMNTNSTHGLLPCYDAYMAGQAVDNEDDFDDEPPQAKDEPTASDIDRMDAVDWDIVRTPRNDSDSDTSSNESTEWKATYKTKLDIEADDHIYLTTAVDWELHRKKSVTSPMKDITNQLSSTVSPKKSQPACSITSSSPPNPEAANLSVASPTLHGPASDDFSEAIDWEVNRRPRRKEVAFYNYGQHRPSIVPKGIPSK